MNIIDTVVKTVTSPFAAFFPKQIPPYVPPPQSVNYHAQPLKPPMTASQELMQIENEMHLPVSGFNDKDAILYLPKMREELQKYRVKQSEKQADISKYNIGQQQIAQKTQQKLQAEINSYNMIQNDRIQMSNQVQQKYNAETQPYITWLNQQQASSAPQFAPIPPIRFG